jgi:hypothetical protein
MVSPGSGVIGVVQPDRAAAVTDGLLGRVNHCARLASRFYRHYSWKRLAGTVWPKFLCQAN